MSKVYYDLRFHSVSHNSLCFPLGKKKKKRIFIDAEDVRLYIRMCIAFDQIIASFLFYYGIGETGHRVVVVTRLRIGKL